jgi:hypothetical protein
MLKKIGQIFMHYKIINLKLLSIILTNPKKSQASENIGSLFLRKKHFYKSKGNICYFSHR